MACPKHKSHAHCPDCGAEFNIPRGFVLISEADLKDLLDDRDMLLDRIVKVS
jgi:hypothetical protein